jgi:hypothetical protein
MNTYLDLTAGLQAVLMQVTRGYTLCVSFETEREKLQSLSEKWSENYGVDLPGWKRFERKKNELPNAWAAFLPVPSYPGRARAVLLRTKADLNKLPPESPWHREKWSDKIEIGDFIVSQDQRDRRDFTTTIKLSPRCHYGLEAHWRSVSALSLDQLVYEARRAVDFYPMFGGVRRQLRRLIRGYAKLYMARRKSPWPGPDPEGLPTIQSFKGTSGARKN